MNEKNCLRHERCLVIDFGSTQSVQKIEMGVKKDLIKKRVF